jgi:hypothetical protein
VRRSLARGDARSASGPRAIRLGAGGFGRYAVVCAAFVLAACGGGGAGTDAAAPADAPADAGPDAYVGPSSALFELPRGAPTSEYYALPFPNDLRRRGDGTLDFEGHDRPGILETYLPIFETKIGGFGTNSAVFFRFDAPIDAATLPASPADSLAAGASVYLVDVDPDSPARGTRVPLRCRFQAAAGRTIGPDWLGCLPFAGFPLRGATTYAAVVTRRLAAPDGTPVGRPADFDALLAPGGGDAFVADARLAYQPLFAWLDEPGGDEREDVIAASVFTTQDPTSLMGRIRQVIWSKVPAPSPADVRWFGRRRTSRAASRPTPRSAARSSSTTPAIPSCSAWRTSASPCRFPRGKCRRAVSPSCSTGTGRAATT